MPLPVLAAATAIAVPLFGHQVADAGGLPVRQPLTFLDRDSLAPLAGAPRLPDGRPELSPDGRRVAVSGAEGTTFFDAGSGRRLGAVPGGAFDTVSWLGPRRLLRIGTDSRWVPRTSVTVIDPTRRRVVRGWTLDAFFGGTSRVGDRQLLVLSRAGDTPLAAPAYALVLDREGRTVHRIDLPDVTRPTLDGSLVCGAGTTVRAVDPVRGTATLRRLSTAGRRWVPGVTGAGLLGSAVISVRTGGLLRRTVGSAKPVGAPRGYLTVDPATGRTTTSAFTLAGRLRWRRATPGTARELTVVLRGRVYQQSYAARRSFVRVLDLATGRTVREVPGVFDLTAPIRGRDRGQVPHVDGDLILDPGD